jgi:hypothetical protein
LVPKGTDILSLIVTGKKHDASNIGSKILDHYRGDIVRRVHNGIKVKNPSRSERRLFLQKLRGRGLDPRRQNMTTTNLAEQWTSMMQKSFLPTPEISTTFRENAHRFWENQDKILNNMQAFSNSWFERRHTGTKSASECSDRVCSTETMVDLMQAYQDWARGAFERMMADGLAWQQHIIAATSALTSPPLAPPVSEQPSEPARSEAKTPARAKTS